MRMPSRRGALLTWQRCSPRTARSPWAAPPRPRWWRCRATCAHAGKSLILSSQPAAPLPCTCGLALRPAKTMALRVTSCLLPHAPAIAPAQHPKPLVTSAVIPPSIQCVSHCDVLRSTAGLQRGAGECGQDCLRSLRQGGPCTGLPMAGGSVGRHAAGPDGPGLQLHCPRAAAQGAACFTTASILPLRQSGMLDCCSCHRLIAAPVPSAQILYNMSLQQPVPEHICKLLSLVMACRVCSSPSWQKPLGPRVRSSRGMKARLGKPRGCRLAMPWLHCWRATESTGFSPQRPVCEHASICSALSVYCTVLVLPFGVLCSRGPVPGAL